MIENPWPSEGWESKYEISTKGAWDKLIKNKLFIQLKK